MRSNMPLTRMFINVVVHKYHVARIGNLLGVPAWRLALHDLSKFTPREFFPYARMFYGDGANRAEWEVAWVHHQNHNPHHWQYWIDRSHDKPRPMPWWAVREMVADWMAASKVYDGHWPDPRNWQWLDDHLPKMLLHPLTKERLQATVERLNARVRYVD